MESKLLIDIGLLIKKHRTSKKISQEKLAYQVGITKNGLGKIELGRSNVKIITLVKIFETLGLNFNEIEDLLIKNK